MPDDKYMKLAEEHVSKNSKGDAISQWEVENLAQLLQDTVEAETKELQRWKDNALYLIGRSKDNNFPFEAYAIHDMRALLYDGLTHREKRLKDTPND